MADALLLAEAERVLRERWPAEFDTMAHAAAVCVERVRVVEDEEAWKAVYPSAEGFYTAHEGRS